MAAYLVGRLQMRDPSWRTEYGPRRRSWWPSVLELPSAAQAKAFYNDPAYAPLIKLRQSGSDLDLVVVDGV